jgi:uronate dehydrogenase
VDDTVKRRVLITGAAGRIGRLLAAQLADRYDLVLTDLQPIIRMPHAVTLKVDITAIEQVRHACAAIDTVVHLAADSRPDAPWETLLPDNIVGTYNVFHAAHESGCRRVIFASSIQVVDGYPEERQVNASMPIRPLNLYAATKAWGEALGSFYAHGKGLSVICLRLGSVKHRDDASIRPSHPDLGKILTEADLVALILASIEAPNDVLFGIFHGISNNRWKRLDISESREQLGYHPQDDAFLLAERNWKGLRGASRAVWQRMRRALDRMGG